MPSHLGVHRALDQHACLSAWGSAEYFSFDPVSLAACSAPARIRSQNVSPGSLVSDHGDGVAGVADPATTLPS